MNSPTAKEVFEAFGYTLGNIRRNLPSAATVKKWSWRVVLVAMWSFIVWNVPVSTIPTLSTTGAWVLFALGVFLLGAAAFCYVLFSFLMTLMRVSPQVAADVQHMVAKAAHPLRTVAPQPETEGAFTAYDDDRGYLQEQFEELVKQGILNETDTIDEVLGENKDFDFDAIKAKARGE